MILPPERVLWTSWKFKIQIPKPLAMLLQMWNSIQQAERVKSILENFVQGTRYFSFITWYEPRNYEYIFLFIEWCLRELVIYASQNIMETCIEDGLFWSKSKVSSQSRGIDGSIYDIRQKATYLLCYSFNIAENRYDK